MRILGKLRGSNSTEDKSKGKKKKGGKGKEGKKSAKKYDE